MVAGVNTVALLDGNGIACRVWFANKDSVPRRFQLAVEKVVPKEARIVACWDDPAGSWRRDVWRNYKVNRRTKPKLLIEALRACRKVYPGVWASGFEADDLLATLARKAAAAGDFVLLVTSDKDLAQLVTETCLMVTGDGAVLGPTAVQEKYGVPPDRIRHLLSWMGDHADGLPGRAGCGPKRAAEAALEYRIGDQLTWELAELVDVPQALIKEA